MIASPTGRQRRKVLIGVALLVGLLPPAAFSEYTVYLLTIAWVSAFATLSLNLLVGHTGQVSIGHSSLVAVGAYTTALVTKAQGVPFPVALLASGAMAGVVGFLLSVPCLRLSGPYLAVATMALGWVVPEVLLKWSSVTGGYSGLYIEPAALLGLPLDSSQKFYYVVFSLMVALMWTLSNLRDSRLGRAFVTIRDSEVAALAMGINVARYKILAFTLSSAIAGFGGGLFAFAVGAVTPFEFGFWVSIYYLVAVVVGGVGSLIGPLLGALFITFVPEFASGVQSLPLIVYGTLLLLVIIAFPAGLAGLGRKLESLLDARRST